jgi:hypothetical protein
VAPTVAGSIPVSHPKVSSPVEAMTFARRSLLLATCVACSGLLCQAQNPAKRFQWDGCKWEKDNWESIGQSKTLSAKERVGLVTVVASQIRPYMSNLEIESEEQLRAVATQTTIKAVDLSGNGPREYLGQGSFKFFCSPTGNCESWVFRKNGDKYSVILHRIATQTFTIQSTITNGFHDLVLGQHGSATDQGLTLYRFDGSKYQRVACYDADWEILGKDGEYHRLKDPRITPTICSIR